MSRSHITKALREPSRTAEEEEIVAMITGTFTEARKMGEVKGEARALLAVFRSRSIPVSDADRERILAEKDPERLERWVERAVIASSAAEVIDEPSQA